MLEAVFIGLKIDATSPYSCWLLIVQTIRIAFAHWMLQSIHFHTYPDHFDISKDPVLLPGGTSGSAGSGNPLMAFGSEIPLLGTKLEVGMRIRSFCKDLAAPTDNSDTGKHQSFSGAHCSANCRINAEKNRKRQLLPLTLKMTSGLLSFRLWVSRTLQR